MKNDQLEVQLRTMLRERARDIDSTDARADFDRVAEIAANEADHVPVSLLLEPSRQRRGGRWAASLAVAAAILLVVCVSTLVARRDRGSPSAGAAATRGTALQTPDGGNASCQTANGEGSAGWSALRAEGAAFSVNFVELASKTTVVHVTRVVPQGIRGSITLQHAAFIPVGGTGNGFPWSEIGNDVPVQWTLRRNIPGTLSYEPDYTLIPNRPPRTDGSTFELVVGVTVGPQGGQADHMRVYYSTGGHNYYVDVFTSVAMYPTYAGCP